MDRETFLSTLKAKFIEMVTEVRQRPLDPRACEDDFVYARSYKINT